MEYVTKDDIMRVLYEEYMEARGYKEGTIKDVLRNLMILWRGTGKGSMMTKEDLEKYIYKKPRARATRNNYRSTGMAYINFREWWEKEGINGYVEYLRSRGYSESTIKTYKYALLCVSGRTRATSTAVKQLMSAMARASEYFRNLF